MVAKALMSSKSNEHYTPIGLMVLVAEFFDGTIDLDPCSAENDFVQSEVSYRWPMSDGLKLPWFGNVWCNPPYGRDLPAWSNKCVTEAKNNDASILFLVPSRTETQWTRTLSKYPRCYLSKRLRFADVNGVPQSSAPFPSALFYVSDSANFSPFVKFWKRYGEVFVPDTATEKLTEKKKKRREYMKNYMTKRRANNRA